MVGRSYGIASGIAKTFQGATAMKETEVTPSPPIVVKKAKWEHFPHEADVGVRGFGATAAQAF